MGWDTERAVNDCKLNWCPSSLKWSICREPCEINTLSSRWLQSGRCRCPWETCRRRWWSCWCWWTSWPSPTSSPPSTGPSTSTTAALLAAKRDIFKRAEVFFQKKHFWAWYSKIYPGEVWRCIIVDFSCMHVIFFQICLIFSFHPPEQRWLLLQYVQWPLPAFSFVCKYWKRWWCWKTCSPSLKSNISARVFTESSSAALSSKTFSSTGSRSRPSPPCESSLWRVREFIAPKASAEGACILSKMGYYNS